MSSNFYKQDNAYDLGESRWYIFVYCPCPSLVLGTHSSVLMEDRETRDLQDGLFAAEASRARMIVCVLSDSVADKI